MSVLEGVMVIDGTGVTVPWLRQLLQSSSVIAGLAAVAGYSFLIAFVLPFPSEVVLAAPLGGLLPRWLELASIVVVSGVGKAAGSVLAFRLGHVATRSGPVLRALERAGMNVREWSQRQTVRLVKRYGYAGLAIALSVPFFPDTVSIYAFSVVGEDQTKFAIATFVGSVLRLLVTLVVVKGAIVLW